MTALVVAVSLLIGVSLGILGGGGSILTVPILVYLAGQETKEAIATSLFVVGVTSIAALVPHARAHRVRWRTGLLFGAFSMAGAYGGGRVAEYVPGTVLLLAFALMMLATAAAMLRRPRPGRERARPAHTDLPLKHIAVEGLAVGAVTGLVGSGGGFLVVPALALLGGLPMGIAVGTSLLVIAMKSFAGLAGHLSGVSIDWGLALTVTAAAVIGSLIGARVAGRIPQDALRKAFGWFVVAMGVFVLAQQLDTAVWTHPATWTALGAAATAVVVFRSRQHSKSPNRASESVVRARPLPEGGRRESRASE
ncbi:MULTISPECIES: sulfite exporter TauE/SafE family protein [Streptomyces]|uniref:Probable membrane transporter protein n=1 Tax=Streptomyces viridochromogenes TaxID=1938 RepID=A0A0L8LC03_STRVR|nr:MULTISPECIES: sulfite exporter TauE/SafE family protein [Streptomyces]KOG35645.1 membrane protein [Streptomyces viridochromogenes]